MSLRFSPRILHGLLLTALLPLQAEEPFFTKDLKVRMGYAPSTQDQLNNATQGFGLNLGFGTTLGRLGVEFGYSNKSGDQFQKPVFTTVPGGLSPVADAAKIGDSRRNSVEGFSVRVSLQREINAAWRWQAGLMLGGTRFKHEYVGDVSSVDWNGANEHSWRDFYHGTPVESGLSVSPYAGVSVKLSSRSSFEINALLFNYKALDYIHKPGTGTYAFHDEHPDEHTTGRLGLVNRFPMDTLEKKSRIQPHIEFAYVFHF